MSNYLSAGLGFIGGLLGNAQQSANIDRQISAQKAENQKNREYNFRLAQQQNQWNYEQWMRENDYNTPKAQMQRFRDAGLNPDLMMSNGAQNLSAQSPQMTSGAPSSPADLSNLANKPTISEAINSALNASQTMATVANTNANTQKTYKDIRWSDLINQNVYKQGLLDLNLGKYKIAMSQIEAEQGVVELMTMQENLKNLPTMMDKVRSEINRNDKAAAYDFVKANLTQKDIDHYAERLQIDKDRAKSDLQNALTNMLNGQTQRMLMGEQWFALTLANNGTLAVMPTAEEVQARKKANIAVSKATEEGGKREELYNHWITTDPTYILPFLDLLTGLAGRVFSGSVSYSNSNSTSNATVNSSSNNFGVSHIYNHK